MLASNKRKCAGCGKESYGQVIKAEKTYCGDCGRKVAIEEAKAS